MFALWLGTFLLASSPALHQLLHADAQSSSHHCVVTQVREHSILSIGTEAVIPQAPTSEITSSVPEQVQFNFAPDRRLSPSRAPPSGFLSAAVAG
jgi:hypothetical protein